MLDIYRFGKVERISPEAPVPVLRIENAKERRVPGGAANVAMNLKAAGMEVSLFSIVGTDENAQILCRHILENGIDMDYSYRDRKRLTTTKLRYMGQNNQQILRVDSEENLEVPFSLLKKEVSKLDNNAEQYSVFVLSDYEKGFLSYDVTQHLIKLAESKDIPVFIDIKGDYYEKYRGATLLKANRAELSRITQKNVNTEEQLLNAAMDLCRRAECHYVLITLGADGMMLADANGLLKKVRSTAREVYDVTGAGDTALAYLSVGLVNGLDILKTVEIANDASGIKVAKLGTDIVYPDEVKMLSGAYPKRLNMYQPGGFICLRELKKRHKKIVFTNGCFDILHAGHVNYLNRAKALGDILVVGLNSDESIKRLKGNGRPINCLEDRAAMLTALSSVDYVVPFEEDTPQKLIEMIEPDVLVKGGDYEIEKIVGYDYVIQHGGQVYILPFLEGKSTTETIGRLRKEGFPIAMYP